MAHLCRSLQNGNDDIRARYSGIFGVRNVAEADVAQNRAGMHSGDKDAVDEVHCHDKSQPRTYR